MKPGEKQLAVHLSRETVKALKVFAASRDCFVRHLVEEFIRDGFKKHGTSVEKLNAVASGGTTPA